MVDVSFAGFEFAAGVLAGSAIAFPDAACAEAWLAEGDFGVAAGDDDGGDADGAARGVDGGVVAADGELEPCVPFHGGDRIVFAEVEADGGTGGHHAEGIGRGFDMDGLPVAVEQEDSGVVEEAGHGISVSFIICSFFRWAAVLLGLLIFGFFAGGAHFDEFGVEAAEDFDEVGLGGHDGVDVFVDSGDFIESGGDEVDAVLG